MMFGQSQENTYRCPRIFIGMLILGCLIIEYAIFASILIDFRAPSHHVDPGFIIFGFLILGVILIGCYLFIFNVSIMGEKIVVHIMKVWVFCYGNRSQVIIDSGKGKATKIDTSLFLKSDDLISRIKVLAQENHAIVEEHGSTRYRLP